MAVDRSFYRTELLIGKEGMNALANATVWVFGCGGVGGATVEVLVRSGVGTLYLVDPDDVSVSNINRQFIAMPDTVGKSKVDLWKERARTINPDIRVIALKKPFHPSNEEEFDFSGASYIIDAVDMVTAKIALVMKAQREGIPIISSMGTGNRVDATGFEITDLFETREDSLARVMRRELRKRGVEHLKVLCSSTPAIRRSGENGERPTPASTPWVPPVAGFLIAGEVVRDIAGV
ncbi:MAG: tRNA threonylcarbamoyladenosine dehydratase [Ruminococcaceae bacterium]|nr:tRNA threonylcarbamoyladenosine dehydratase [Oscillospiraceae bacterium]